MGLGGSRLAASRMREGGMVRRPFLKTYLAMLDAKMAGCCGGDGDDDDDGGVGVVAAVILWPLSPP